QASNVYLQWLTANEVNNDYFNVQFSNDGSNGWTTIGKVNAGNGNYSFLHTSPVFGSNYYRLQQVDKDGRTSYSEVRMVQFGSTPSIAKLYPNPITGYSFTIDYGTVINKPITYYLYDANGKLIKQGSLVKKVQTITLNYMTQGRYVLKFEDGTMLQFVK
ncbi:MAG: T9SS type A sorting domain-containing protein, partial [Deinococcales bacterium]|nr:T9SS type A sorting domain-containing protein [Chitinophagaceae bacterium]